MSNSTELAEAWFRLRQAQVAPVLGIVSFFNFSYRLNDARLWLLLLACHTRCRNASDNFSLEKCVENKGWYSGNKGTRKRQATLHITALLDN
jgi:hypothetical protein